MKTHLLQHFTRTAPTYMHTKPLFRIENLCLHAILLKHDKNHFSNFSFILFHHRKFHHIVLCLRFVLTKKIFFCFLHIRHNILHKPILVWSKFINSNNNNKKWKIKDSQTLKNIKLQSGDFHFPIYKNLYSKQQQRYQQNCSHFTPLFFRVFSL